MTSGLGGRGRRLLRTDSDFISTAALFADTTSRSRREAPEPLIYLSPQTRAPGECRMPAAPAASCAIAVIERTRVTTSTPESPGIPARNGFTVYSALSPVTGLFCHRRPRIWSCLSPVGPTQLRELDASVVASGSHDFAVRNNIARPCAADRSLETRPAIHGCAPDTAASTASRLTSVTIAIRPFVGRDGGINKGVSTKAGSEIFLQMGLDTIVAGQPRGQIS
jgi:hypothetical protein